MSKRLRAVGAAAPAVAALAANSSTVDSVVSSMYGGDASSDSLEPAAAAVDSIFSVLGSQILDLGGKLRPEMLDQAAGPPRLKEAVGAIDALLALLPRQTVDEAQRLRADARAANPSTL